MMITRPFSLWHSSLFPRNTVPLSGIEEQSIREKSLAENTRAQHSIAYQSIPEHSIELVLVKKTALAEQSVVEEHLGAARGDILPPDRIALYYYRAHIALLYITILLSTIDYTSHIALLYIFQLSHCSRTLQTASSAASYNTVKASGGTFSMKKSEGASICQEFAFQEH